jgi:DNA-binding transcriptional LysR family regulator
MAPITIVLAAMEVLVAVAQKPIHAGSATIQALATSRYLMVALVHIHYWIWRSWRWWRWRWRCGSNACITLVLAGGVTVELLLLLELQ